MPLFSIFTPFGALEYSSSPSLVEKFYDMQVANLNTNPDENFNLQPGSNIEASVYARSRVYACGAYTLRRAFHNASPSNAIETLALHEKEFQVIPGPLDDIPTRRNVLAARALLPNGAVYTNVVTALTTLLGSGFVFYRVTTAAEAVNFPAVGGDSPGNFVLPKTIIKNIRITNGVSIGLGAPQSVAFSFFDENTPKLLNGDKLVVEPEILGQTEVVEVSEVTSSGFKATFEKSHDLNCIASTVPYPYWISTQRHCFIVVTQSVAEDANKRRQIHELLARLLRGVSTWDIVPDDGGGTDTFQYTIGNAITGRVGFAPIDIVSYP